MEFERNGEAFALRFSEDEMGVIVAAARERFADRYSKNLPILKLDSIILEKKETTLCFINGKTGNFERFAHLLDSFHTNTSQAVLGILARTAAFEDDTFWRRIKLGETAREMSEELKGKIMVEEIVEVTSGNYENGS